MAGIGPVPVMAEYGASKSYLWSLSLALHEELKSNIDVLTCSPGYVDTKMIAG